MLFFQVSQKGIYSGVRIGVFPVRLQPVAATLTKNVFLWLATFGQKIEIDPVAQLKIVKHH